MRRKYPPGSTIRAQDQTVHDPHNSPLVLWMMGRVHTRPLIANIPTLLVDMPRLMRRSDRQMEWFEVELSIQRIDAQGLAVGRWLPTGSLIWPREWSRSLGSRPQTRGDTRDETTRDETRRRKTTRDNAGQRETTRDETRRHGTIRHDTARCRRRRRRHRPPRARMQHPHTDLRRRRRRRAPCTAAAAAATDAGRHARLVPEDGALDNRREWVAALAARRSALVQ